MPSTKITDELLIGWSDGCVEVHLIGSAAQMQAFATDDLIAALRRARRAAFGLPNPSAVVLEVVERGREIDPDGPDTLILPNTVLINGQPVYTNGVRVHTDLDVPKEMAQVTVTLPVRLFVVGAEGDLTQ